MAHITISEVRGFIFDGETICHDCFDKDNALGINDLKRNDFILENDVESEEDIYFCDSCENRIL